MSSLFAMACAALISSVAMAQGFPSRAIKIVTPYSTGIGPDLYARALGELLQKEWGQPVVVEAKPGGNGFIAVEQVRKAAPDGHELLVLANSHLTINPSLFKNVPYDPINDLTPIAGLYRAYFFIAVKSDGPYQTIKALIAGAKANPGKLTYGTPYVGSPSHLGSAIFEHETGTQMVHAPFKDTLQIFTSIANGDVSWAVATASSSAPMVKAGRVKLIAVAAPKRLASHPDVPTVEEAGGPKDFEVEAWLVLLGPRGMAPELAQKIGADVQKVLATPQMRKRTEGLGFETYQASPPEIAAKIRTELRTNAEVIKRVGAKAD
ncbi:MAG: tripartite tricarboxylate transporter substrate binding protein [Betaproteobacteria bacterium]|nr:MAG: tripartite tricarboxylate transporter substrate binding protein [Betaproteobacteria bacterium]